MPKCHLTTNDRLKRLSVLLLLHALAPHIIIYIIRTQEDNGFCSAFLEEKSPSCFFHNYTTQEALACLRPKSPNQETRIHFVGDSHMRNLFQALKKIIWSNASQTINKHGDNSFYIKEIRTWVSSIWSEDISTRTVKILKNLQIRNSSSSLLVMNGVLWPIIHLEEAGKAAQDYRSQLTEIAKQLDELAKSMPVLWYVQPPVIRGNKGHSNMNSLLTNKRINQYNQIAIEVLRPTRIHIWYAARLRSLDRQSFYPDELHIGRETEHLFVQQILNYLCNKDFNFKDGTCCTKRMNFFNADESRIFHLYLYIGLLPLVPLCLLVMDLIDFRFQNTSMKMKPFKIHEKMNYNFQVIMAMVKVILILAFIYLIARSSILPKKEKEPIAFSEILFIMLLPSVFLDSLFFGTKANLEILQKETIGLLVAMLFLNQWHESFKPVLPEKISIASSILQSLLLMAAGLDFYCNFMTGQTLKQIIKIILQLMFVIASLNPLMDSSMDYVTLFSLLLFNMALGSISLALLPVPIEAKNDGVQLYVPFLRVACSWITTVAIYGYKDRLFKSDLWLGIFQNLVGFSEEWISRYEKDAFCFWGGMLLGFELCQCHCYLMDSSNTVTRRVMVTFLTFLIPSFIIIAYQQQWNLVEINFEDLHATISFILMSCYLLLRLLMLLLKDAYVRFFSWVGEFWMEFCLLCPIVGILMGSQVFLLFPFYSHVNSMYILSLLIVLSSYLFYSTKYLFDLLWSVV